MSDVEWDFYSHRQAPGALDIVWCHFPIVEQPDHPGPKPRPALVRRVFNKEGRVYLEVCYGTSNLSKYSNRDLYVANLNDMIEAGLYQATVFHLDRTVTLPWSKEWFTTQKDGRGPIVGSLSARSREYLKKLVGRRSRQP